MGIECLPRGFARVGAAGQERTVEGRTGLFFKEDDLDEIVFRTAEGDRYLIYADELIGVAAGFVVVGAGVGFYLGGLMAASVVAKAGLAWGDTVAVLSATTATGSGGTLGCVATSASGSSTPTTPRFARSAMKPRAGR